MTRLEHSIIQSHFPVQTYIILDTVSVGGQPKNAIGRIMSINQDLNTITVEFDNGFKSSLIYGTDKFHRYTEPRFVRSEYIDDSYS